MTLGESASLVSLPGWNLLTLESYSGHWSPPAGQALWAEVCPGLRAFPTLSHEHPPEDSLVGEAGGDVPRPAHPWIPTGRPLQQHHLLATCAQGRPGKAATSVVSGSAGLRAEKAVVSMQIHGCEGHRLNFLSEPRFPHV